jgi:hypothetical protein
LIRLISLPDKRADTRDHHDYKAPQPAQSGLKSRQGSGAEPFRIRTIKVNSMAKQEKDSVKPAPAGETKAKPKAKPAAGTAEKEKAKEAAPSGKEKEKAKPAPRPPADPRLKVLKKFHGKFLPRGPLRDRYKALMERWNSGEEHGGVTALELRSLYDDWKMARAKPARTTG